MDALQFMRDHQAYFEDYVTRSTYHSNAIEGSTLSFAETYAILWNDNTLKVTATARELYEAINHKYALATASENMDLLARSDYDGLAAMLRRLSEAETERMERFAEL